MELDIAYYVTISLNVCISRNFAIERYKMLTFK